MSWRSTTEGPSKVEVPGDNIVSIMNLEKQGYSVSQNLLSSSHPCDVLDIPGKEPRGWIKDEMCEETMRCSKNALLEISGGDRSIYACSSFRSYLCLFGLMFANLLISELDVRPGQMGVVTENGFFRGRKDLT